MKKDSPLLYPIYIIMCSILLLFCVQPAVAARWQKPAFYSRFEKFTTAKLYSMGDDYLNKREMADSALVCFTIIANRMSDGQLNESEYETAVKSLNLMGNIYSSYFNRFDLADDCLTTAADLAEKYGFNHELPYILGNKGNLTYVSMAINNDKEARRKYVEEEMKVFNAAVKVKEWRCVCVAYYNLALFSIVEGDVRWIEHQTKQFGGLKIPKDTHFYDMAQIYYKLVLYWKSKNYAAYAQLLEQSIPGQDRYTQVAVVPMMRVQLAMVYKKMGQEDKARKQLSLLEQKAATSKSLIIQYVSYDLLTDYWQEVGDKDMESHYDYLRLKTKEKLNNESKLSEIQQTRFLRQLNQVGDQLKTETAKKRASQRAAVIVSVALLIILVMILILWRMYRKQGKYVDLLYQRNQQLLKGNQLLLDDNSKADPQDAEPVADDDSKEKNPATELPDGIIEAIEHVMQDTPTVCSHDFSMARLCDLAGYNRTYISQAIRQHYGTNFNGLLNSYRIREACRRLADSEHYANLTIEAIADSLGYASRSNFSQVFKRITGLSASEYQKKAMQTNQ